MINLETLEKEIKNIDVNSSTARIGNLSKLLNAHSIKADYIDNDYVQYIKFDINHCSIEIIKKDYQEMHIGCTYQTYNISWKSYCMNPSSKICELIKLALNLSKCELDKKVDHIKLEIANCEPDF